MRNRIANLKMWQKFSLIGVAALCMISVPTVLVVREKLEQIDTSRQEAAGMAPIRTVLELIRSTQLHRGLSAGALAGSGKARDARAAKQTEVDDALARAMASMSGYKKPALQKLGDDIATEWRSLASSVSSGKVSVPDSFERHTALVARELKLLEDLTDASTLSLDPQAGSYYLITAVLGDLPRLSEKLGQMRGRGMPMMTRAEISPDERFEIKSIAELVRTHAENAQSSFGKAIEADPAIGGPIEKPMTAAAAAIDEALKLADDQIIRAAKPTMTADEYFARTSRIIDAQFELASTAFKVLDDMLIQRVAANARELWLIAGGMLLFGGLSCWLIVLVTRTTTRSVSRALEQHRLSLRATSQPRCMQSMAMKSASWCARLASR